jgi:hypothetical protein
VRSPLTGGTQIEIISPDYVTFAPEDRDLIPTGRAQNPYISAAFAALL